MNHFKLTYKKLLLISFVLFLIVGCGEVTVTHNTRAEMPGDGLNLYSVGRVLKRSMHSMGFERDLNISGINNLDINEDGMVDYISVREFGRPPLVQYSLFVAFSDSEVIELATIGIQESMSGRSLISIRGNEELYGPGAYYNTSASISQFGMYSVLYRPGRTIYVSPYSGFRQPDNYVRNKTVERTVYQKASKEANKNSSFKNEKKSSLTKKPEKSPNAGKKSSFLSKIKSKFSKKNKTNNATKKTSALKSKPVKPTNSKFSSSSKKKTTASSKKSSSKKKKSSSKKK
jgi:hypothetical protein